MGWFWGSASWGTAQAGDIHVFHRERGDGCCLSPCLSLCPHRQLWMGEAPSPGKTQHTNQGEDNSQPHPNFVAPSWTKSVVQHPQDASNTTFPPSFMMLYLKISAKPLPLFFQAFPGRASAQPGSTNLASCPPAPWCQPEPPQHPGDMAGLSSLGRALPA